MHGVWNRLMAEILGLRALSCRRARLHERCQRPAGAKEPEASA
jgi:hypothetical protein